MTIPRMSISPSPKYAQSQSGGHGEKTTARYENSHTKGDVGLPKMMPRSAVTRSSLTPSPSASPYLLGEDLLSAPDHEKIDHADSSASTSRHPKAGRLSMMDFLAAESPEERNFSSTASSSNHFILPASTDRQSSLRSGGKLFPSLDNLDHRSDSLSGSTSALSVHRMTSGVDVLPATRSASPQPKIPEYLYAERSTENRSIHPGKGKRREATDSTPLIQLKVIPITDSIIMFGSTQTSSNYSLSGVVVLRMNSDSRKEAGTSNSHSKRQGSPFEVISEGNGATSNVRRRNSQPASPSRDGSEEIQIKSLQVIFSGFALYVDHTGRFSAMKLANVKQELLSQGTSIPSATNFDQEYEIGFNLSVPGWLPSTLSTRFGGTFYCLEAKVEYLDVNTLSDPTQLTVLFPPRNTSRAASPSPLSTSMENSSYDSDPPTIPTAISNKDEQLRRLLGSQWKDQDGKINPANEGNRKGNWLSKLAKVSKASGPSRPNSPSNSVVTPIPVSSEGKSPTSKPFDPPSMLNGGADGIIYAQSKAKAIIVARCREVVPVPVARMAIIGPEGLPEGAHQDSPPPARSSSFDAATRSRSSTITRNPGLTSSLSSSPPQRSFSPPPLAPSAFTAPSDPSKFAAHTDTSFGQPRTPQRASSATQLFHARGGTSQSSPTILLNHRHHRNHNSPFSSSPIVPMRHFLHRPMLHPPADAQIQNVDGGLSFALTLTLPSYVSVDGPGSDVLSFGIQIEVGRSAAWSKVRDSGGLRLRDMELSCVQTERHSSVASRTFCHSYPVPLEGKISPHELPIMESRQEANRKSEISQQEAAKLRTGYDRAMVEAHMDLVKQGRAPLPSEQNVERVRVAVVGPPTSQSQVKGKEQRDRGEEAGKSKEKNKDKDTSLARPPTIKKARRRSMPTSNSAPSGLANQLPSRDGYSEPPLLNDFVPPLPDREGAEASRRTTGRGRRAYQSAIRGLSNLATAVMDITLDTEGGNNESDEAAQKKKSDNETKQTAVYSFAGADGHGVDLTKGRVRMAINLPLVSSNTVRAKTSGTPRLVADFESPYIRVRHKLKVKLGFGFGSKPLGTEGDGNWGQALVMCVPVRFTDSAPREVREQFAPMPIAQVASSITGTPCIPNANKVNGNDAPLLPSYNQLFREDGSRLADEGEDLPQYPGPARRRISAMMPSSGSVTAPSPSIANTGDTDIAVELTTFDNRITPSRVVDESLPEGTLSDVVSRQQQLELQEMQEEEEIEEAAAYQHTGNRLNETVNISDMEEDFGEDDAIDVFTSSDQAPRRRRNNNDEESSTSDDEFYNC